MTDTSDLLARLGVTPADAETLIRFAAEFLTRAEGAMYAEDLQAAYVDAAPPSLQGPLMALGARTAMRLAAGDGARYFANHIAAHPLPAPTVDITREMLESWAGRALTDDEVTEIDEQIPLSPVPEMIGSIVDAFDQRAGGERR